MDSIGVQASVLQLPQCGKAAEFLRGFAVLSPFVLAIRSLLWQGLADTTFGTFVLLNYVLRALAPP